MPSLDKLKNRDKENLEFITMPRQETTPLPKSHAPRNRHWFVIALITGGTVLVLAVLGYFVYQQFFAEGQKTMRKLPDIAVIEPPATRDSDNDGLSDEQEKEKGTDPAKADSDSDGLADGDEVNIYESDPLLYDTDEDGFEDGQEAARGFSPIVNSKEKAAPEELQKWAERIAKFGIHEPTPTTLKLKALKSGETGQKVPYSNTALGYSFEIPSLLTFREQDSGQKVGVYISGTIPEDENVLTDLISVSTAVKVESQTLRDWIASQYQEGRDYQKLEELEINSVKALKLLGMPGEACPSDRTFFSKDGSIVILTWTCTDIAAFGEFYNQIIQSFRF